jgi:hypothetical protein
MFVKERTESAVNRGVRILWPATISATKDQPLGLRLVPGYFSRGVIKMAGTKDRSSSNRKI